MQGLVGKATIPTWSLICRGLVRSQLDAGQREEAARMCAAAAQLARRRAPNKMVDILKLQVQVHGLNTLCPGPIPRPPDRGFGNGTTLHPGCAS